MIEAQSITIRLNGRTILSDVSFSARPGAFTVIAGPNGSGKSTLVKALSGEIGAFGGIYINGCEINTYGAENLAAIRGVLPQSTPLSFPFRVTEILEMGLAAGRHGHAGDPAEIRRKALAAVDLAGYEQRLVPELSGGEQQRVHLARLLCQISTPLTGLAPRWLLLDEPVSSLDIRHQLMVMQIGRLFAASGGGVIAVMHDLNLSLAFADHFVLMKDGKIIRAGRPGDVISATSLEQAYGLALPVRRVEGLSWPVILPSPHDVPSMK